MGKKDKRIDAYINKSADFARPILKHLRKLVHEGCPEVTETIKWGFPHFDYKGILCSMASFKQHCTFGFWKASVMEGLDRLQIVGKTAMGHFGKLTSLRQLPSDKVLLSYIREAARLNDDGVKPQKRKVVKSVLKIPKDLSNELSGNKSAMAVFQKFSYSNKKEYVDWITEARTDQTRRQRLATAIEWMAEGKIRNWKYVR